MSEINPIDGARNVVATTRASAAENLDAKATTGPVQGQVAESISVPTLKQVAPPSIPDIGEHPLDRATLAGSPSVGYLAHALRQPGTVGELFDVSKLDFVAPPDPTTLLQATHATNARRPKRGVQLRVVTYNVALLDTASLLKPVPRFLDRLVGFVTDIFGDPKSLAPAPSPEMAERKARMAEQVFGRGDEIVMLQEVWIDEDAAFLVEAAQEYGYVAITSPRSDHTDGLVTFIKASAIDMSQPIEHASDTFHQQKFKEKFFTHVLRGYQIISFRHPRIGRINVINTHTAPFMADWELRLNQARQLGIAVAAVTKQDEVTLLGGDLNAAPYYGVADWKKGGKPTEDQMRSAMSYGVLQHYSGMSDLVVAGRPAGEETADVELGRSPPSSDSLPRYPFSSDRTNPLTLSQYGPDGSLARLDYIFGRGGGRIAVERSDMLFSENLPGLDYPLSDHFGFGVQMRIRPRVDLGQPSNSP